MIDAKQAEKIIVDGAWNAIIAWYATHPEYNFNERDEDENPVDDEGNVNWDAVGEALYGTKEWHTADYSVKLEDEFGGEGKGDEYYYVWSITTKDGTQYFKVDAYYSSWNGTHWDDAELTEVEPVEVVKREWR
jgi:hypothetical protein